KAQIDGRRVALTARAFAYGASATAQGRVTLPDTLGDTAKSQPIPFDVSGQVRHVDLRKMPRDLKVPPAETNVNADYHAAGTIVIGNAHVASGSSRTLQTTVKADAKFQPSTVAAATIAGGSTVGVTVDGQAIAYSADATVSNLDLQR